MDYTALSASNGSGEPVRATVQNVRNIGSTSILVNATTNWPTGTFIATTGTLLSTGKLDPTTVQVFSGTASGTTITIASFAPGYTDKGNAINDVVVIKPNTEWANLVAQYIKQAILALEPAGTVKQFAGAAAPTGYLLCDGSSVLRATYPALFTAIGTTFGSVDGTHFTLPDGRGRTLIGAGTNTWIFTFASTDVNTGTDQVAVTASPELITGRKVQLTTTGALPTGLALSTDYYLIVIDTTHVQFASSLANAVAGTQIDITGAGSGTNTATHTGTARTLGQHGGEEGHATTLAELPAHAHAINNYTPGNSGDYSTNAKTGGAQSNGVLGSVGATLNNGSSGAHNNMQPFLALNHIIKT